MLSDTSIRQNLVSDFLSDTSNFMVFAALRDKDFGKWKWDDSQLWSWKDVDKTTLENKKYNTTLVFSSQGVYGAVHKRRHQSRGEGGFAKR